MLLRMRPTDRDPDRAESTRVGTVVTVGSDFIHDRAQRFAVGKMRHNANFARVPRGRRRRPLARLAEARGSVRSPEDHDSYLRDPEGSNRVGLIVEVPDMAAFEEVMQSEAGAEAMKFDGVRPETLLVLTEG
jgi:hypothetical protein